MLRSLNIKNTKAALKNAAFFIPFPTILKPLPQTTVKQHLTNKTSLYNSLIFSLKHLTHT